MSAPFAGPPELPFATDGTPRPRREARRSTRRWPRCPGRVSITSGTTRRGRPMPDRGTANRECTIFLRAYYHHKSADWKENKPHRLAGWTAAELAKMPTYYIMDLADDMPAAVARRCRRRPRSPPPG